MQDSKSFRQRLANIIDADCSHNKASIIYDWVMVIIILLSLVPLMFIDDENPILEVIS